LDNANSIKDGTLYFWEHYGGDSHNLKDYQAGYGLYNLGGGTPASAHSNVSSLGSSVKTPKSYIAVGQGFFVTGDSDGGQIQFNNGQRVFQVEDSVNSVFMKGNASTALKTTNDERLKIRIGFNSSNIDHRQILLTVDERATKNVDWGFDAEVYDLLDDDMFWMINDKKFGIQGINEITNDMEIPVGIKTKLGGLLNVKIDSLENIAGKFEIYFKDTVDNSLVQLTNQSLDINLTAGEYLNRFSLVFKSTEVINEEAVSIETEALILPTNYEIFMNNEISELQIRKKESLKISTATIVNYLGQVVKNIQGEFEDTNISIPVNLASGLYFVQLNSNQGIINNKIIVK
ncbi:T9SS type A sorting domain-containing protein, partial [Lutibacter sp.]|uniref:T9SS type A sorting domain-containing protein n=1 Tax=Lutibacter sp. TaxID=1925666 RepID=UPI003565C812